MAHTQGRLTADGNRIYLADTDVGIRIEIAVATKSDPSYRKAAPATAAELVRRWNAFEEGGAVALAIEALRMFEQIAPVGHNIARAALASLEEAGDG